MLFLAIVGTFLAHVQVADDDNDDDGVDGDGDGDDDDDDDNSNDDGGGDNDDDNGHHLVYGNIVITSAQQVVTRLVCGCPAFYWAAAGIRFYR